MTIELKMLAWTAILGLVQLLIVSQFFTAANGLTYNMGPRDEPQKPLSTLGGRFKRAFANLMETFPFAAAAILIAAVTNRHNGYTEWGSQLYFWARLVYVPLYAAGIPGLRSLIWVVSLVGIILVFFGLTIA
jgi:uncharacterized MAPEG superfamily protein